jgi:hypothetical protein
MYFDYILGNYSDFRNDYFLGGKYTVKASIVSSLGLISFFIGYISSINYIGIKHNQTKLNPDASAYMKFFSYFCFSLFIVNANSDYFNSGYGNVELSPLAVYAQTFLFYFILGVIALKSYGLKVKPMRVGIFFYLRSIGFSFNLFVVLYLFLVLLSGDRGPIIQVVLIYFAGYIFSQHIKVKLVQLLFLIFSASLFITFLGEFRSLASETSYSERVKNLRDSTRYSERNSSFSPNTHELAISVRTVHAAMEYTEEEGYSYGMVQLNQLIAIFPGAGRVIRTLFELDGKELISADIITEHLNAGHGMGTSTVTDLYIDLSIIGVIIGLYTFGVVVRKADVVCFSPIISSFFLWVVILVLISKSIYIGRSSIMILLREIITVYVLILVCGGRRISR